jgi:hypothetical protein
MIAKKTIVVMAKPWDDLVFSLEDQTNTGSSSTEVTMIVIIRYIS